jgi:hypothetical protein
MNDINSSFFFGGVYKIAVSYQYFLLTIKLKYSGEEHYLQMVVKSIV